MPVFQRRTTFDASLDDVWELHTTGEGLKRLTPTFFGLRVEAVRGGAPDEPLPVGAEIDVSTSLAGLAPRDRWTAVVTASERDGETAIFRDEMRGGAFPEWIHTHRFESVPDGTRMTDRIQYRLPTRIGGLVSPLAFLGFEPMFRYRHRTARRFLES